MATQSPVQGPPDLMEAFQIAMRGPPTGLTAEQMTMMQGTLRQQIEEQAAFFMHQLRNEQVASVIKISEINMT